MKSLKLQINSTNYCMQTMNKSVEKRKNERISTMEIKQGLEKIKNTQLEVLKELRREQQVNNFHQSSVNKYQNQNMTNNIPYVKSSSHINLLKATEINNMRREFSKEKERFQQQTLEMTKQIHKLEKELQAKQQSHMHSQPHFPKELELLQKNKKYQEQFIALQENLILETNKNQQNTTELVKEKQKNEENVKLLEIATKQNEKIALQNKRLKRSFQDLQLQIEEKNNVSGKIPVDEKKHLNLDNILIQIRRISNSHDVIYQSLKSRARLTKADLDSEEEVQQSFTKILSFIESSQKYDLDEESAIQGVKGYESESFREDFRRLERDINQSDLKRQNNELKKQHHQIKAENLATHQQNNQLHLQIKQLINQHSTKQINFQQILNTKSSQLEEVLGEIKQKEAAFTKLNKLKLNLQRQHEELQQQMKRYLLQIKTNAKQHLGIQQQKEEQLDKLTNQNKFLLQQVQSLKEKNQILVLKVEENNSKQDDKECQYKFSIREMNERMIEIVNQKNNLSKLIQSLNQNIIKSESASNTEIIRQQMTQIVEINHHLRKENQHLKRNNDALVIQIETVKHQRQILENSIQQKHTLFEKEVKEKDFLLKEIKTLQNQKRQQQQSSAKLKIKSKEIEQIHQTEHQKYEENLRKKVEENNILRGEVERNTNEHRSLREIAFKYQVMQGEHENIKRKFMRSNGGIEHLWEVKETEYQNIHEILKQVK